MHQYNELRFYCFTNFYLSSIQHGIQTGHASVRLLRKYQYAFQDAIDSDDDHMKTTRLSAARDSLSMVEDWADNHGTYITLNGGDDDGLRVTYELVSDSGFPFAQFFEPGIGNARTAVGVILPDTIFNMRRETVSPGLDVYVHLGNAATQIGPTDKLYPFMGYLKSCGLAR